MKSVDPALFPYESKELAVGPHRLRYVDEGDGDETLLCVHGNPTWSFYYRGVIDRFRETHRVIAVDHIGCGRSDKPARGQYPYTMAAHRDDLVALIDSLDLRRVTLIAHDWGGDWVGVVGGPQGTIRSDRVTEHRCVSATVFAAANCGVPDPIAGDVGCSWSELVCAVGRHDGNVSKFNGRRRC